jgi:preprotein translocase subunit SecA
VVSSALETIVRANCPGDYSEEWDLEGLLREVRLYYPTEFTVEDISVASSSNEIYESVLAEALAYYETREQSMPAGPEGTPEETMRSLEREVMLQIIDQKWREHLSEMDYLREGINLRAMGQQDPLVEWQREGFDMFGQLMASIDDDYVKIVMHAQVQVLEQVVPDETAELAKAQYLAADDPVQGNSGVQRAIAAGPAPGEEVVLAPDPNAAPAAAGNGRGADLAETQAPIVKDSMFDKVGRNDACPCGSGKKFKFCHGRQ